MSISGSLGALYLIDRQGRQKLLIGSYLGMVSCSKKALLQKAKTRWKELERTSPSEHYHLAHFEKKRKSSAREVIYYLRITQA